MSVSGVIASILDPVAQVYYSRAKTDVVKLVLILAGLGVIFFVLIKKR